MEETNKRSTALKVVCYVLSLILLLGSAGWLALTHQPLEAYLILFLLNASFFLMAFFAKKEEHRPTLTLIVSFLVAIQAFFVVMGDDMPFLQTLCIELTIMTMAAVACVWYMVDKQSVHLWLAAVGCFFGIFGAVNLCSDMQLKKMFEQQLEQLNPVTMVIEGIYQRNDIFIVDFEQHGPYVVEEEMLVNLNAGDTVLVKATKFDVFSIKRKL